MNVEMLPDFDADKNRRPWHAKMLGLTADRYSALMIGSSNFTCAGMGAGSYCNAEANLLTIVERVDYGRDARKLEAVWPDMDVVADGMQVRVEAERSRTPDVASGDLP